jgi:hypothetical protein
MKKLSFILLSFFLLNLSCRKPEDSPAPSSVIRGKNWKLIYYSLNGTEKTDDFINCVVSFKEDGSLNITNNRLNYSGDWMEFSEPPKLELNINTGNYPVSLLSRTWENKLLNPTRIELVDFKIDPQEIVRLDLIP